MSEDFVYVSTTPVRALPEPQFLIKIPRPGLPDLYYLTLAVLEYDATEAGTDQDKIDGCAAAAAEFDNIETGDLVARVRALQQMNGPSPGIHTAPPAPEEG